MSFGDCLSQYKKKEVSNPPTVIESVHSADKDRVFNYCVNAGLENKPCEKPFECHDGVELNFNFWTDNRCLIDSHVIDMLVSLLNHDNCDVLRSKSEYIDRLDNVILVCAHGIDPRELGSEVKSLPFLSHCSSMPINHVQVLDTSLSGSPVRWQYLDAETMNGLVLWPERPSLEGSNLLYIPKQYLFTEYNTVFLVSLTVSIIESLMLV